MGQLHLDVYVRTKTIKFGYAMIYYNPEKMADYVKIRCRTCKRTLYREYRPNEFLWRCNSCGGEMHSEKIWRKAI